MRDGTLSEEKVLLDLQILPAITNVVMIAVHSFEIGQADQVNGTLVDEAGKLLVTFVDKFARALEKHGKVLSLDVETADVAWWNATALNASALSSMVDMSPTGILLILSFRWASHSSNGRQRRLG